jgi:predicted amidohydrolase
LTDASCDLLITGGYVITVVDADSSFFGDVAITGNSIVAVGPNLDFKAKETIDASGCIKYDDLVPLYSKILPRFKKVKLILGLTLGSLE